jgi:hypothetical protein
MKSVCTFIETYTVNHGRRYVNHFESMSLPEQDKILPKDAIPDTKEIDNLLSADIIMLDNMDTDALKEAIAYIDGRAEIEVSGNVTKENIARLTGLGVDYVSSRETPSADFWMPLTRQKESV